MRTLRLYILIAIIVFIAGVIYFINLNSAVKTGLNEPITIVQQSEMKKEDLPAGRQENQNAMS